MNADDEFGLLRRLQIALESAADCDPPEPAAPVGPGDSTRAVVWLSMSLVHLDRASGVLSSVMGEPGGAVDAAAAELRDGLALVLHALGELSDDELLPAGAAGVLRGLRGDES